MILNRLTLLLPLLTLIFSTAAEAEPYLAARTGLKCMTCHVNPGGGGMRTEFGRVYGQTSLVDVKTEKNLLAGKEAELTDILSGKDLGKTFMVGTDVRANLNATSTQNQDDELAFDFQSANVYMQLQLIPDVLSLYVDQQIAPNGSLNREAYALYWFDDKSYYLKAGRMFLPYGLRLEDDSAFIRQVTGINFDTPDNGVETGLEIGSWSASLAITNGTAGGGETNTGKQYSFLTTYVQPSWRLGGSYNYNDGAINERRQMGNLFLGLRTYNIAWLAEYDYIVDDLISGKHKQGIGFLEANLKYKQGHNLKLTYEYLDPDTDIDEDERVRYSMIWEYTPIRFNQIRLGYRRNEGIPQNDQQNSDEIFVQNHIYF